MERPRGSTAIVNLMCGSVMISSPYIIRELQHSMDGEIGGILSLISMVGLLMGIALTLIALYQIYQRMSHTNTSSSFSRKHNEIENKADADKEIKPVELINKTLKNVKMSY